MPLTNVTSNGDVTLLNLDPANSIGYQSSPYVTTVIDYFPIQRWGHLAVVLKQSNATVYLNGDIYSVISLTDGKIWTSDTDKQQFARAPEGDLVVFNRVPGYISNIRFYNYSINQNDVQNIYSKGPTYGSWLSWLSLGRYKLQSPVVKISDSSS